VNSVPALATVACSPNEASADRWPQRLSTVRKALRPLKGLRRNDVFERPRFHRMKPVHLSQARVSIAMEVTPFIKSLPGRFYELALEGIALSIAL
jgi:hypothetical protein